MHDGFTIRGEGIPESASLSMPVLLAQPATPDYR